MSTTLCSIKQMPEQGSVLLKLSFILPGRGLCHLRRGLLAILLTIVFRKFIVWYVLMNRGDIPPHQGFYRLMHKKCATCDILLDVPCANPSCAGHHNESLAEMCVYCATNEQETQPFLRTWPKLFVSSLHDSESDETTYEERSLLES